jgi:hypothetical protein
MVRIQFIMCPRRIGAGDPSRDNHGVKLTARMLERWVGQRDGKQMILLEWCQGYRLPLINNYDDPLISLLSPALSLTKHRSRIRRTLICTMAQIFEEWERITGSILNPERVLCELLNMSVELSDPKRLFSPLLKLGKSVLELGSWRGLDNRFSLCKALCENQVDDSLKDTWAKMIRGEADTSIRGGRIDGFHGLIRSFSPRVARQRIWEALKEMALNLTDSDYRRAQFLECLTVATSVHPVEFRLADLLGEAMQPSWPHWATECLLDMSQRPGNRSDKEVRMSRSSSGLPELFLCHSSADKTFVRRLAKDLTVLGAGIVNVKQAAGDDGTGSTRGVVPHGSKRAIAIRPSGSSAIVGGEQPGLLPITPDRKGSEEHALGRSEDVLQFAAGVWNDAGDGGIRDQSDETVLTALRQNAWGNEHGRSRT